jgi:hypothetical protein
MPHTFGIGGLILNTIGALGLLKYAANPDSGSPLSPEQLESLRSADKELRRPYERQILAYRLCLASLALGFVLQIIDLIIA